ncbi:MAG: peptidoglycan-associated lipoprotein Pal [Alphaproteobacteria bacterium]|nr:peptidoglycan-associated lipoprotein Pal [Alphaproteobacteria bacterium]MDE2014552.1 peptidoglycan-associated lipoprotein Pal [Alphaproteobacteria bacterium]MDE2074768.1 peptidoglycan-associated lipoprotein Pal [Alphaproteobacteria bacterium]
MLNFSRNLKFAAAILLIALAGCTPRPDVGEDVPPVASSTKDQSAMSGVGTFDSGITAGSLRDLTVNVGDTVYFDYEKSELSDSDRATLQRQAAWLQKYAQVNVTIQGNCDERGTREYNLALGALRASAVKSYLVSLGVSASRIETISFGRERPVCTESTETCWARNRRAVTVPSSAQAS